MQVETFLGSSDLPGFDKLNGSRYRSISYQEGVPGLEADVSVGMGSVNVIWLPKMPSAPEAPLLLKEEMLLKKEELPSPPEPPKKTKVVD